MQTYSIIAERATLAYSVRRILRSRGAFTRLAGFVVVDNDGAPQSLYVSIDAYNLRTGLSLRDRHLKAASYLDAERYPLITYSSEQIEKKAPNRYTIRGQLRLHGQAHPVTLEATLEAVEEPDGALYARVSGVMSRAAFAIPPNPLLQALLRVMVGDAVHLASHVYLTPVRDSAIPETAPLAQSRSQN